jgi:hypothetical protein
MTNAVLAINNLYETASVITASSEATGFDKENAFDGLLYDYWQPNAGTSHTLDIDMGSAVSVDLFGFYSSDFYTLTGAACKLYYSDDDAIWTLATGGTITPTTASPKLKLSTSASHRYWRLQFDTTGSEQPKIQHAYIGAQTEMQRGLGTGFEPMALASENVPINSESTNGMYLGRSTKKKPVRATLTFRNTTAAWMRSNWPTILAALESRSFMILPSPDSYTDEAAFCWTTGAIKTPRYDASTNMGFSIPILARIT